jgi:D-alanyl-D-alanine carboxypeptidase (penicillin-binding protein 5/6)
MKLLKQNKINFIFIFLVILLTLFSLPTLDNWSLYSKKGEYVSKNSAINQFEQSSVPIKNLTETPQLNAGYFILIDNDSNTVLLSKNPNQRIYPASTTKLVTALTALNIYPLDEEIDITEEYKEGKVMELVPGEKITIKSLVTALLVYSANDSAYNLAKHQVDGIPGFIKQMNNLLVKYNIKNTHFVNYDGLHDPNHYSTAYDLAQLGRIAIKNSIIRDVVKNKTITVTDVDNKIEHQLTSTNELLGVVPEIEGLKTGWTPEAEGCFVGLININGHLLISVVAQSQDRFNDTKLIVDWAKQNLSWREY